MAKKTLVTGATGTIGREVTKHLAAQGVSTRAGVRDRTKARKQFGDEIELVAFAFEDKRLFDDALEDVEKVFLLPPAHAKSSAGNERFRRCGSERWRAAHCKTLGNRCREREVCCGRMARGQRTPHSKLRSGFHFLAPELVHAEFH